MARIATAAGLKRFSKKHIISAAEDDPDRILLYGEEGIGKTTFGAEAPKAVFIPAEVRFRGIEVDRFPRVESWDDLISALTTVEEEDHDWETVVIDTIDALEMVLHDEVARSNGWANIEEPGWMKGQQIAVDYWREMLVRLDRIREKRNMQVILLAHSRLGTFKDPESEGWSVYEPAIHKYAYGLMAQWADSILFGRFEMFTVAVGKKKIGKSSGRRVIHTKPSATWRAKDTWGLPAQLAMSYDDYANAREAGAPKPADALWLELKELLAMIPEDIRSQKEKSLMEYAEKSPRNLAAAVERVRQVVQECADESETTEAKEES